LPHVLLPYLLTLKLIRSNTIAVNEPQTSWNSNHCLYTTTPAPEPGHPTSELLQQLDIGKQNLYNRQKIFHTLDYNCSTNILRTELLPVDHRKTSLTISYDSFVKICLVLV